MVALTVVCALLIGRSAPITVPAWSIHGDRYVSEGSIKYSVKDTDGKNPEKVIWTIPDGVESKPPAREGKVELAGSTDLVLMFPALPKDTAKLPILRKLAARLARRI